VHLDIIKDAGSRETAYEQGKYDVNGYGGYSNLQVADILRVKGSSSLSRQLLLQPKVPTTSVRFNLDCGDSRPGAAPLADQAGSSAKDLRTAFNLAVDKSKLVNVACSNVVCTPATGGLITKGLKGYLGDNQDPLAQFDAAKAKSLLKGADPDGSKTKDLTYVYDPENPLNGQVEIGRASCREREERKVGTATGRGKRDREQAARHGLHQAGLSGT